MTIYDKCRRQLSYYMLRNGILNYEFLKSNELLTVVELSYSPRAKIVSESIRKYYEYHNANIKQETEFLISECEKRRISPVFVKGIVSVSDVYGNLTSRFIGDVDLYLKEDEAGLFLEILAERNYIDRTSGIVVNPEWVERYKVTSVHMSPFVRTVSCSGCLTDVTIEVHIFPYFLNAQYGFLRTEEIYNSFFSDVDVVDCFGVAIPAPNPICYLAFLLDHVAKHLCSSLEADIYEGSINNPLQINLLRLFEAKVYFENHKRQINPDALLLHAKRCNAYLQVLCGIHFVNELFPGTFKFSVKCKALLFDPLSEYSLLENRLCLRLCDCSLIDILKQSESLKKQLLYDVFESQKLYGSIIEVPHRSSCSCANFMIDNYAPENNHGLNIMHGQRFPKEQFSLSGFLNWDESFLYIQIDVTDDNFPEKNGNILTFHIGDGLQRNSCSLHLRVFGESDNFRTIFVKSCDSENDIRDFYTETSVEYTCHEKSGYRAEIKLPWSVVNVTTPKQKDILEFDVEFKRYDGEKLLSMSSLGCIRETYSTKYGNRILLV